MTSMIVLIQHGTMIGSEIRIIYGDPGTWKTQFILSEMKRQFKHTDNTLAIFNSLELPEHIVWQRFAPMLFGQNYDFTDKEVVRELADKYYSMTRGRLVITNSVLTTKAMADWIYAFKTIYPNKRIHVYIDSLSILSTEDKKIASADDNAKTREMFKELQTTASHFNVAMTVIHHNNRTGSYLGSVAIKNASRIMFEFVKIYDSDQKEFLIVPSMDKVTRENVDSPYSMAGDKMVYLIRDKYGELIEKIIDKTDIKDMKWQLVEHSGFDIKAYLKGKNKRK